MFCAATAALASAVLAAAAPAVAMPVGYNDEGGRFLAAQEALAKADIQVARFGVYWASIEPKPGEWDFSFTDKVIAALQMQGVRPILSISGSPTWANGTTAGISCPCDRAADPNWQEMWAKVAERYPDVVLNIWNEPNYSEYGGVSTDRMAELTNEAAAAIWAVNPQQIVVAPPIAPINGWRPYAADFYPKLDPGIDIAANSYPYGHLRQNFRHDLGFAARKSGHRPIWITEVNVSRRGSYPVTPRRQARFLNYAYSYARQTPHVKAMVVHRFWSPYSETQPIFSWDAGQSALTQDGTATKEFNAIRGLHGAPPTSLRAIPAADIPAPSYPLSLVAGQQAGPVCSG